MLGKVAEKMVQGEQLVKLRKELFKYRYGKKVRYRKIFEITGYLRDVKVKKKENIIDFSLRYSEDKRNYVLYKFYRKDFLDRWL